jgi:hypothetical protein
MIERRPLSEIEGMPLSVRRARKEETYEWGNDYLIVYRTDTQEKVGSVKADDFFDADGNRFVMD